MNVEKISNPQWADKEHTAVNCMVKFEHIEQAVPFTATASDTEAYGRDIYAACQRGEAGEIYSIGTYIIAALAPYTTDIGRTYQPGETVSGSRLKRCALIKDENGNYMKANTDGIDGNLSSVPGSWMVCNEITSTNDNEGIGLFQRAY